MFGYKYYLCIRNINENVWTFISLSIFLSCILVNRVNYLEVYMSNNLSRWIPKADMLLFVKALCILFYYRFIYIVCSHQLNTRNFSLLLLLCFNFEWLYVVMCIWILLNIKKLKLKYIMVWRLFYCLINVPTYEFSAIFSESIHTYVNLRKMYTPENI